MSANATIRIGVPVLLAVASFFTLLSTNSDYGYAIDEASYVFAARGVRAWFSELDTRPIRESFTHDAISANWHFLERADARPTDRHSNFNLPMAMHVMNAGWLISHAFCSELTSYRIGSMFLFSLTIALTFSAVRERTNVMCGLFAACLLFLNPRPFAHAHLAATETPLCCFWMLTLLSLSRFEIEHSPRWRKSWALFAAIFFGCLIATKLTGWLIVAPMGLWLVLCRPAGWIRLILLSVIFGVAILFAATPNLWFHPLTDLWGYVRATFDNPWKISTAYQGTVYQGNMPIESGLVIFAITNPMTLIGLGAIGFFVALRDRLALLLALCLLFVLAVRTFGLMPTHDVDRQFLMAYYLLPVLSAVGLGKLCRWLAPIWKSHAATSSLFTFAVMGVALIEPIADWRTYKEHGLCYFQRMLGGVRGAAEQGYEISYWFETVTDRHWREMIAMMPANSKVFFRPDHPGIQELIDWGLWRKDLALTGDPSSADYLLLYAKPSAYSVAGQSFRNDLWQRQQQGPAVYVIEFEKIRLLTLIARK